MLNDINIIGNLTTTPNLKSAKSDSEKTSTSFILANDRPWRRNKDTGTNFIPCSAFQGEAEFISRNFVKGQLVAIRGHLHQASFEYNGEKRNKLEIVVDDMESLGKKPNRDTGANGSESLPTPPEGG